MRQITGYASMLSATGEQINERMEATVTWEMVNGEITIKTPSLSFPPFVGEVCGVGFYADDGDLLLRLYFNKSETPVILTPADQVIVTG